MHKQIYIYIYHARAIAKRKGHEFEGELGGVFETGFKRGKEKGEML